MAVAGDMREPEAILTHDHLRGAGFCLAEPACVILGCVLHFGDAATARGVVATLSRALAPGSYLVISVWRSEGPEVTPAERSTMIVGGVARRA